jgi:hypothetical protein
MSSASNDCALPEGDRERNSGLHEDFDRGFATSEFTRLHNDGGVRLIAALL